MTKFFGPCRQRPLATKTPRWWKRGVPDVLLVPSPILRVIQVLKLMRLRKKMCRVLSFFAFFIVVSAIAKREILQYVQTYILLLQRHASITAVGLHDAVFISATV